MRMTIPTHDHWMRLTGCLGLCAALLAFGCDSGPSRPDRATAASAPTPQAAAPARTEAPRLALPKPGVMSFDFSGGRVTLVANRVPAQQILDRMGATLRFDLEVAGNVILPRAVSVRLEGAGIDAALEQVLIGFPYSVFYDVDADDQSRVLSLVQVGEFDANDFAVAAAPRDPPRDPAIRARIIERVQDRTREEQEVAYEINQEAWYDDLYDPDPGARAYAVEAIYLDESTFPILTDLLANDPDPRVRAAAAGTLSDDLGNTSAADALLIALDDPNSEVVIEALDALEDVGDSSNIADVQPLLLHPDSEVREEAINTIEWLAD